MKKAVVVLLLGCGIALAGCSGSTSGQPATEAARGASGGPGSASAVPPAGVATPVPSGSAAASSAAPIVVPARVGDCFAYKALDHWVLAEGSTVDCATKHTATTVYVGSLSDPAAISFEEAGQISDRAAKAGAVSKLPAEDQSKWAAYTASMVPLTKACDTAIAKRTKSKVPGGVVTATLFTADFTGPTQAEWQQGARWVRCNLVARLVPDDYNRNPGLMNVPTDLKTALRTTAYRNCWVPRAQGKKVASIACTSKDAGRGAWLTLSDHMATGTSAYPGQKGALAVAKGRCMALAQHMTSAGALSARWWTWQEAPDGTPLSGSSKGTWGTPAAHIGCAVPNWQFRNYR